MRDGDSDVTDTAVIIFDIYEIFGTGLIGEKIHKDLKEAVVGFDYRHKLGYAPADKVVGDVKTEDTAC